MAHSDWDSIDKFTQKFDNVYCAFLDILGYKNKSEEFFANSYNLLGRYERALASASKIMNLSSVFLNTKNVEINFFSDSIIIVAPQNSNNLVNIMHFSRILSAQLGFEGLFIRGGISGGKHLKTNINTGSEFLASEALQKAYKLESDFAVNPRILVDDSLLGNASKEEKELIIAEKNEFIVDCASILINRDGNNEEDVYKEMEDIYLYMNGSITKAEIKRKYEWLLDFYYWTITESNNFNISRFEKFNSGTNRGFKKM
jgi:hypothetical protein